MNSNLKGLIKLENNVNFDKDLKVFYLSDLADKDCKEEFMRLRALFVKLKDSNSLPTPKPINFDKVEEKVDEGLEFGKKIFGDFLQVKEE